MCQVKPGRMGGLTEQEKWECTVRWLNDLYTGYYNLLYGAVDAEGFLEWVGKSCDGCPHHKKCPSTTYDPYRPTVPIPVNFKVLEKFTPGLSVAGPVFPLWGIPHKDKVSQNK
ncbi:hypothetical protein AALC25_00115 [Lachnospiraceae bacterium 29-84]